MVLGNFIRKNVNGKYSTDIFYKDIVNKNFTPVKKEGRVLELPCHDKLFFYIDKTTILDNFINYTVRGKIETWYYFIDKTGSGSGGGTIGEFVNKSNYKYFTIIDNYLEIKKNVGFYITVNTSDLDNDTRFNDIKSLTNCVISLKVRVKENTDKLLLYYHPSIGLSIYARNDRIVVTNGSTNHDCSIDVIDKFINIAIYLNGLTATVYVNDHMYSVTTQRAPDKTTIAGDINISNSSMPVPGVIQLHSLRTWANVNFNETFVKKLLKYEGII